MPSSEKYRYFKIINSDGTTKGKFSGYTPKYAANKALTSILKEKKLNNENVTNEIYFSIIECTGNNSYQKFNFLGKRVQLKNPLTVTINNGDGTHSNITYGYTNKVKQIFSNQINKDEPLGFIAIVNGEECGSFFGPTIKKVALNVLKEVVINEDNDTKQEYFFKLKEIVLDHKPKQYKCHAKKKKK